MSAVYKRASSSSFSSRSTGGSSAVSMTAGMQLRSRMSSASVMSGGRAPSVYGGAGGYGTRISQSVFSSGGMSYGEMALCGNEKVTMQNLNDRLASYLDKVRSLEAANRKLELQIREFYDKKGPVYSRDLTVFFGNISDLRAQILRRFSEHQQLTLQVDNARLTADDFKMKFETELNMRMMVEADLARLRGVLDSLTLARSDLEVQIESLKEELVYVRRNHEEEIQLLRVQQTGAVNVEVDCAESADLTKTLEEIREQYEAVVQKNQREVEKWFQNKVEILQTQISTSTTQVKTTHSELSELKRTYQSVEIELQAILSQKQYLEQSLADVGGRYSVQLSQLQLSIHTLEAELQQLTVSIQQQATDYKLLLDIKMRLELEIAEYRRLLEGETRAKAVVISQVKVVEKVEAHKPHIERRVKTIVEEVVDGRVVSSVVDTEVQEIQ
ncbi:keratin 99 [Centroberyx gerrardi]|uniref:keratin 99 isoform X1 n=1 Tax=Centroberyx gerrardi TaxID=166262 RepID=UPI003AAA7CA4